MSKWKKYTKKFNIVLDKNYEIHIYRTPQSLIKKIGILFEIKFGIEGKKVLVTAGEKQNERG